MQVIIVNQLKVKITCINYRIFILIFETVYDDRILYLCIIIILGLLELLYFIYDKYIYI